MNPTVDHTILSSFKEYLDHTILDKLAAYDNRTLTLFTDTTDPRLSPNYALYSSGKPQWVYDASISGANIPTAISHASGSHSRGDDNMRIDFVNGRAILDSGTSLTGVTVNCATKRFNSYLSTSATQRLVVNTTFERRPDIDTISSHVKGDRYFGPCYFVKFGDTINEGFALGGEDKTGFTVNVTILARGDFEVVALAGAMRDMVRTCFTPLATTPIDEFGDLKTVGWNYSTADRGSLTCHIDDVKVMTLNSDSLAEKFSSIHAAQAVFQIFTVRTPRG